MEFIIIAFALAAIVLAMSSEKRISLLAIIGISVFFRVFIALVIAVICGISTLVTIRVV